MTKKPAAAAAAPKPPKPIDPVLLRDLIARVDRLNVDGHRLGLIDDLTTLYRMKIADMDNPAIRLAGVTGARASTLAEALTNWTNAARRALNTLEG